MNTPHSTTAFPDQPSPVTKFVLVPPDPPVVSDIFYRRLIFNWMMATALGWFLALGVVSIGGLSSIDVNAIKTWGAFFGPQFEASDTGLVFLYILIGLLTSLPQALVFRRWTDRYMLWVLLTVVGSIAGGLINASWAGNDRPSYWAYYGLTSMVPIAITQWIAFIIFFQRTGLSYGCLASALRTAFIIGYGVTNGLLIGGISYLIYDWTKMLGFAFILYAYGFGLPFGFVTGCTIRNMVTAYLRKHPEVAAEKWV